MNEIVKTKDGQITFRRSEFHAMSTRPPDGWIAKSHELIIYTDVWSGGRIFRFDSAEAASQTAKEIQDQL